MTTYRTLMALVVLVASPAFAQSQRRDNPTVKDTLRWMQTSLESGSGDYWVGHETRSVRLEDFAGCRVHFSASTHQQPFANGEPAPDKKPTRIDYFFELGDIDPANITFSKGQDSGTEVPSFITIRTRNDEKKITSRYSWEPEVGAKADDTFVIFAVEAFGSDNDYVVRFAKAFKHAVEACGGKPSLFADSDRRDERVHTAPDGVAVQSKPHRKDIATIAKEANGAVVSIVMSDKEGHPIAQGSGFLISKDGWVVTNYHVIKSGSSAVVKLPDGAFFPVDGIVASDKGRDVAIIKAHGNDFRTLTFGDSARLQVGEEVVAIGNPLSLESTVSNGIVSAIRTVEEEGGKFLQITAPISHGSSGGPLLNMAGEVVGITSAVIMGGENLNFAIPINEVNPLLDGTRVSKVRGLPDEAEDDKNHGAQAPNQPVAMRPDVGELQKENRLPGWANYVCYEDSKNIQSGWFMIVAYRSPSDTFLKDANAFGYKRGLTYQEYISSNKEITAFNVPISQESAEATYQADAKTGQISLDVLGLLTAQVTSVENASAIAKAVRKSAAEAGMEKELLGDEEEQALLDFPNGTNYRRFLAEHHDLAEHYLARQKYLNAGIIDPHGGYRTYLEGNVIFEKDFGSEVFETATGEKATDDKMLRVRIEMQDTSTGLRFVKSHSLGSSGIGIPIAGKCNLISRSDEDRWHGAPSADLPPATAPESAPTPTKPAEAIVAANKKADEEEDKRDVESAFVYPYPPACADTALTAPTSNPCSTERADPRTGVRRPNNQMARHRSTASSFLQRKIV